MLIGVCVCVCVGVACRESLVYIWFQTAPADPIAARSKPLDSLTWCVLKNLTRHCEILNTPTINYSAHLTACPLGYFEFINYILLSVMEQFWFFLSKALLSFLPVRLSSWVNELMQLNVVIRIWVYKAKNVFKVA